MKCPRVAYLAECSERFAFHFKCRVLRFAYQGYNGTRVAVFGKGANDLDADLWIWVVDPAEEGANRFFGFLVAESLRRAHANCGIGIAKRAREWGHNAIVDEVCGDTACGHSQSHIRIAEPRDHRIYGGLQVKVDGGGGSIDAHLYVWIAQRFLNQRIAARVPDRKKIVRRSPALFGIWRSKCGLDANRGIRPGKRVRRSGEEKKNNRKPTTHQPEAYQRIGDLCEGLGEAGAPPEEPMHAQKNGGYQAPHPRRGERYNMAFGADYFRFRQCQPRESCGRGFAS